MPDFRFEGTTNKGKPVHGVIQADKKAIAKKKILALANSKRFKVNKILQRRTFLYKASKDRGKPFTGEQKAFSKEEVKGALERLNYKVLNVNPKLFDIKMKPPDTEIVTFVRVSADLLGDQLPFNEILQLLVNDIENNSLRESIKEVINDLQHGVDSEEAFVRQEKMLGRFAARMLGLASKSGNMVEIYNSTATFLERNLEFKKSIKSALVMPMVTMILLILVCIFYIAYIFPQTAELFIRMGIELPPLTAGTIILSRFLIKNMSLIMIGFVLSIASFVVILRFPKVQLLKDKFIFHVPIMGSLIHKTTIEIFCRVFYALYGGAGESIEAIKLSAEACGNKHMENRIKTVSIPLMLSKGIGLVEAFEAADVFTQTSLSRFHSGAETGTIKRSALQIANYYQKETVYKLKGVVDSIQVVVAMMIMVIMIALTVVSSETATIKPKTNTQLGR
ncbi:MAG: type II secretion system F family protein [Candidatus Electryonea clarkiae]|nr:type II secretion system F family protein [Candidatus Electryonea clarkiae]MDP8288529.1 type II secretion system F family protein [Candidatus Electryonea clarkiae]